MRRRTTPIAKLSVARVVGMAALALTLAAIVFAGPARADDTAVGGMGGSVYPIRNADIRLDQETAQAVVYGDFAEYLVEFHFVNDGPAQEVMLGFPFAVTADQESGRTTGPESAFQAWQDGRPLKVTMGRSLPQALETADQVGYFLHRGSFPPGPSIVTVRYLARPSFSAGSRFYERTPPEFQGMTNWLSWHSYWLHTGSTWNGPIGKAVVRYSLADSFLGWAADLTAEDVGGNHDYELTSPADYTTPDERTFQWAFAYFEPVLVANENGWETSPYDIRLMFSAPLFNPKDAKTRRALDRAALIADTTASSFLESKRTESADDSLHAPVQAVGDPGTSWAEGAPGPGIGERLRFTFVTAGPVREVRIVPGDVESLDSFAEHGRPKTLRLTFAGGASTLLRLADEPSVQRFAVKGDGAWAELEIVESYPGTANDDTYIAAVEFGREPAPVFLPFADLIEAPSENPAPSATSGVGTPTTGAENTGTLEPSTNPASSDGLPWWTVVTPAFAVVAGAVVIGLAMWWRRRA